MIQKTPISTFWREREKRNQNKKPPPSLSPPHPKHIIGIDEFVVASHDLETFISAYKNKSERHESEDREKNPPPISPLCRSASKIKIKTALQFRKPNSKHASPSVDSFLKIRPPKKIPKLQYAHKMPPRSSRDQVLDIHGRKKKKI